MGTRVATVGAALAVLAGGCGGSDTPERSVYADRLAALCERTRAELEEVGESREIGYERWATGTIRVGRRFVRELDRLGPSELERARAKRVRDGFDLYYRGTSFALGLYRLGETEGFRLNQQRANDILETAEEAATQLGAPECAERPFSD